MRLAVFTNQFPGRVSTFFSRDMRGLIDAGTDVEVFAIYPNEPALWRYVPDLLNDAILPRRKVHHLNIVECLRMGWKFPAAKNAKVLLRDIFSIASSAVVHGIEPLAKSGYIVPKAWVWANQYINRFDHVLAYWGNYAGTCAYLFHRLTGGQVPFSLFLHAGTDLYRMPVFMREKLIYADNIITCSDFNERFIREKFADIAPRVCGKIHVHHHGIDVAEFAFDHGGRSPRRIIAVGRVEREKGFDYVIEAVYYLLRLGVDVEAEIVGDGSCTDYLKARSRKLGISARVMFRGWLTPDETKTAMRRATILVHPSPELGDGVPNVIKECMSLGTPVIGSQVAGIPELLDHGKLGILVPPKNVHALAHAIKNLLSDRELQQRLAVASRKQAENKFDMWLNGRSLARVLSSTSCVKESRTKPHKQSLQSAERSISD